MMPKYKVAVVTLLSVCPITERNAAYLTLRCLHQAKAKKRWDWFIRVVHWQGY